MPCPGRGAGVGLSRQVAKSRPTSAVKAAVPVVPSGSCAVGILVLLDTHCEYDTQAGTVNFCFFARSSLSVLR